jgi:hypothetical protein
VTEADRGVTDRVRELRLMGGDTLKALAQVTPVTAVVAGLVDVVGSHRNRKQMRWLVAIVERHDGAIEDLAAALSDDRRLELISSAMAAASEAHTDEKILLLADITGDAIRPGATAAQVDLGQYLIDVLGGLAELDIRVLRVVGTPRRGVGQLAGQAIVGGMTRADIVASLGGVGESVEVAVARLIAAGFVDDTATGRFGGIGPQEGLGPTAAGRWILASLDQLRAGG